MIPAEAPVIAANSAAPVVGVVMGSQSDWDTMQHACGALTALEIPLMLAVPLSPRATTHNLATTFSIRSCPTLV